MMTGAIICGILLGLAFLLLLEIIYAIYLSMLFREPKAFIKEADGKIRFCDANIARMNVVEYNFYFNRFSELAKQLFEGLWEALKAGGMFILQMLGFVIGVVGYLIILLIGANISIKRAKKEVEFWNKPKA